MMSAALLQKIAIWFIPLVFAITVHEAAHGWVASKFGDQTAKLLGRLTLNPVKHIDVLGTIIVPVVLLFLGGFIFGWAKPVPVSTRNFTRPRLMMAIVAAAGPVSNLLMAALWALLAKLGLTLAVDNRHFAALAAVGMAGVAINVFIGLLNLLPIPPLDGSRIVSGILPPKAAYYYERIEPYGLYILLLLLVTGILGRILYPLAIATIQAIRIAAGL